MIGFDDKRQTLLRVLTGGLLGMCAFLLFGWISQPGLLFGAPPSFAFTFCYNHNVPEALGALLGFLLWFLFGAEAGIATLPFADEGRALLLRSLCHFVIMALTLWAWVCLNFAPEPLSSLALTFLLPFTLIYILVWLGRWVGWYVEIAAIRKKLGLAPGPSLFHWRETLPYLAFALLLCDLLPAVLRFFDPIDAPILTSLLLPLLLLPAGGFFSGLSLGRRQGFCPLYPIACGLFALPPVFLLYSSPPIFHCVIVLCAAFWGNITGGGMRRLKARRGGNPRVL